MTKNATQNGKSMLKGLVFTTFFPNPLQPTAGVFVLRLIAAMERAVRFRIIAPVDIRQNPAFIRRSCHETMEGLEINHPRYFTFPKIFKWLDGELMYRFTKQSVRECEREFKSDFIYAHYAYPDGFAAMRHARDLGKPMVITVHGSDLYLLAADPARMGLIRETLAFAKGIIAVSRHLKSLAVQLGVSPEKVVVIPNGVDPDMFRPLKHRTMRPKLGIPDNALVLLGVGRLVPLKRFHLLIRTLAAFDEHQSVPVYGVIVGSGPEARRLYAMAKKLGVAERLRMVGSQAPEALVKWYNVGDILLVLSTHEGSPNVVLEALSCGMPVVVAPVGDLAELLTPESGIVLNRVEVEEVVEAVKVLWERMPFERDAIRQTVAPLSWTSVANQQISFIKEILRDCNEIS